MELIPNVERTIWANTFEDLPSSAVEVKIRWDDSQHNWDPESPVYRDLDPPAVIVVPVTCW